MFKILLIIKKIFNFKKINNVNLILNNLIIWLIIKLNNRKYKQIIQIIAYN